MGLSACLLPFIIILQRQRRLISDFTESVLAVRDDGTIDTTKRYGVYLRSFTAEQYYLEHTYDMTIGFEMGCVNRCTRVFSSSKVSRASCQISCSSRRSICQTRPRPIMSKRTPYNSRKSASLNSKIGL